MENCFKMHLSVATSLLGISKGGIVLLVAVLVSIASIWFLILWKRNGGHIEPLSQDEIDKYLSRKEKRRNKKDNLYSAESKNEGKVIVLRKHKGEDDE